VRFKANATTAPIDLDAFRHTLPILAARWRALRLDAGGVEKDGAVKRGLRVESGAHPRPGVRYRLVPKRLEPDTPSPHVWFLDLRHDDTDQLVFHVADAEKTHAADVTVIRPSRVEGIEVDWVAQINEGGWLTSGLVTVEVKAEVAESNRRPRLDVRIGHRHLRAHGVVEVDVSNPGRWKTSFEGTVRGHGALRPVAALAAPLVRALGNRQLKKAVRGLPQEVDEFNEEVAKQFGNPPSPDGIAELLLAKFLDDLADAD
jgi:hypothetical protein